MMERNTANDSSNNNNNNSSNSSIANGGAQNTPNTLEDGRCACGRALEMVGVQVTPTTGGQFELRVAATDSVEFLRRLVSKRLRVPKERICLLYKDRHLRDGTLVENCIMDGARITLLPSVETGLLVSPCIEKGVWRGRRRSVALSRDSTKCKCCVKPRH
ncbi:midnolin-like [Palaemon carinicauda]|uniref:midnolin-like n=1 Tax=Palaemon carinicauda TaxID=392227 RepID=UPI0035B57A5A